MWTTNNNLGVSEVASEANFTGTNANNLQLKRAISREYVNSFSQLHIQNEMEKNNNPNTMEQHFRSELALEGPLNKKPRPDLVKTECEPSFVNDPSQVAYSAPTFPSSYSSYASHYHVPYIHYDALDSYTDQQISDPPQSYAAMLRNSVNNSQSFTPMHMQNNAHLSTLASQYYGGQKQLDSQCFPLVGGYSGQQHLSPNYLLRSTGSGLTLYDHVGPVMPIARQHIKFQQDPLQKVKQEDVSQSVSPPKLISIEPALDPESVKKLQEQSKSKQKSRKDQLNGSTRKKFANMTDDVDKPLAQTIKLAERFRLVEEPSDIQRKAYKTEHRCLVPTPLMIVPIEGKEPRILSGVVAVKLLNGEGDEVVEKDVLQATDQKLSKELDPITLAASFALKIVDTSDGPHFRLLFTIQYRTEQNVDRVEHILSRSFAVYSNRKKLLREQPVVIAMKPVKGFANGETEIWIKGRGFGKQVTVKFGSKVGKIIELNDNLITVYAPKMDNEQVVTVDVSNKYGTETVPAANKLTFTYVTQ